MIIVRAPSIILRSKLGDTAIQESHRHGYSTKHCIKGSQCPKDSQQSPLKHLDTFLTFYSLLTNMSDGYEYEYEVEQVSEEAEVTGASFQVSLYSDLT